MKVLSLDPGGTTGWMTYDSSPFKSSPIFDHGQLGPEEHHDPLVDLMDEARPEYREPNRREPLWIICESFQYRNGLTKAELISCEYIGLVKWFQKQHFDIRVIFQTAAQGKITPNSFVKKKHLERLGLWSPGMKHAMDAYGHFIYYSIHGGNPEFARLRTLFLEKGWKG